MDNIDAGTVARLRAALEALPEPAQGVFRLHVVEGLDYGMIAGLLQLSIRDVEALLAEAIFAIGKALDQVGGP